MSESDADTDEPPISRRRRRLPGWVVPTIKLVLAVVVVFAVTEQVRRALVELDRKGGSFRIDVGWLAIAGLLYAVGLVAFGTFFWLIIQRSPRPIAWLQAQRAYVVGHLGKYVPGKALVLLIRGGMVVGAGGHPAAAVVAVFYETVVMLMAGALLAVIGFVWGRDAIDQPLALGLVAAGLALGFAVLADPRIFPRLAARISRRVWPESSAGFPALSYGLQARGLALAAGGWICWGLSQAAVIASIAPGGWDVRLIPLIVAAVAFATVLGFVIVILPAGLGLREWALMTTLTPSLGLDVAVLSTLLLRLVWLAVEVAASALLFVVVRPLPPGDDPS